MKRSVAFGAFLAFLGSAAILPAKADTIEDPLHGLCAPTTACAADNNVVTPVYSQTPSYGFTVSPGPASGSLDIAFLIPNNISGANAETISISGGATSPVTASLAGMWNSQSTGLPAFLGLSTANGAPPNPLNAFLPTTQAFDPGATGYYVYLANVGTNVLLGPSATTPVPVFSDGGFLFPLGSSIVGFLNEGSGWITTAQSGQLSIQNVPEPGSITLLVAGLFGLFALTLVSRRRALQN